MAVWLVPISAAPPTESTTIIEKVDQLLVIDPDNPGGFVWVVVRNDIVLDNYLHPGHGSGYVAVITESGLPATGYTFDYLTGRVTFTAQKGTEDILRIVAYRPAFLPGGGVPLVGHTLASHTDTGAGGGQLDELVSGGATTLHSHPGDPGNDLDAIHVDVAGEIAAIAEKVTPVAADLVVVEDSAAGNVKKRVQVGNLPGGAGGITELYTKQSVQNITAASDTITVTDGSPYRLLSANAAYTLTSQPTIAAGRDGQAAFLKNVGSFNITLQDVNALGGSLLRLTANTLTIQPGGTMKLIYDATIGFWIEQYLLNPQTFTPSISGYTVDGFSSATHEVGGASELETAPTLHDHALTYVGTPSACSIDISGGEVSGADYPISLVTPFLAYADSPNFYRGTTVGSTRIFTATATVAGQGGLQRTVTITYNQRRYMGPNAQATLLSVAQVRALDGAGGVSDLTNSRSGSFAVTIGAGEYCWFAYREAVTGTLYFAIASEIVAFNDLSTLAGFTNDFNGPAGGETFHEWRSANQNLGAVTVVTQTSQPNNRIYMGPHTGADITDAQILTLDDTVDGESVVSSSVARTYTAIKIEAGEYLWFCHPDRVPDLATIKDDATGFGIDGAYQSDIVHTNQWGYQETYRRWRSTNTGIFPSGTNITVT